MVVLIVIKIWFISGIVTIQYEVVIIWSSLFFLTKILCQINSKKKKVFLESINDLTILISFINQLTSPRVYPQCIIRIGLY